MATATYPPPPPYYRLYKDYEQNPSSAPEPPPPIQGTYLLYGANYTTDDVLPTLEDQGVRQLYPKGPNVGIEVSKQRTTAAYFRACRCFNRAAIAIRKESGRHFSYIQEFASPPQFTTSASGQSNIDSHTRTSDTKTKASCGGHKKEERRGSKTSEGGTWNIGRT
ncbi:hypothetical protein OSB04_013555, partial [Centaurea solstitialis]